MGKFCVFKTYSFWKVEEFQVAAVIKLLREAEGE